MPATIETPLATITTLVRPNALGFFCAAISRDFPASVNWSRGKMKVFESDVLLHWSNSPAKGLGTLHASAIGNIIVMRLAAMARPAVAITRLLRLNGAGMYCAAMSKDLPASANWSRGKAKVFDSNIADGGECVEVCYHRSAERG